MMKARNDTICLKDIVEVKITPKMAKRAKKLADRKLEFTYDRYGYSKKMRWKKIYLGELVEEATKTFIDKLGLEYICYNDIREDKFKDEDPFDFKFGELLVDLKSSRDNRDHGILEILRNQHLVVPIDQKVKDVVIQAFLKKSEDTAWVCCWAAHDDIKREENIGYLHWQRGKYYLILIQKCRPLRDLRSYLISKGAKVRRQKRVKKRE